MVPENLIEDVFIFGEGVCKQGKMKERKCLGTHVMLGSVITGYQLTMRQTFMSSYNDVLSLSSSNVYLSANLELQSASWHDDYINVCFQTELRCFIQTHFNTSSERDFTHI